MWTYGLSAFTTLFAIFFLKTISPQIGLIDRPGGRKIHSHETPVIGGIAIFLGIAVGCLFSPTDFISLAPILLVAFLLLAIGALDDALDLSAKLRFTLHVVCGIFMAMWCGERIHQLGDILGIGAIEVGLLSLPLTAIAVTAAINTINMSDGIDGLAGSIALSIASVLLLVSELNGDNTVSTVLSYLIIGLVIFLCFNFRFPWKLRADIFMGDAGSTVLGFILVWATIRLANNGGFPPVIALWVFAIPLGDTIAVMIKRKLRGAPMFSAGKDHMHHLLLARGFSVPVTVLAISICTIGVALIGIGLHTLAISDLYLFIGALLILSIHVTVSKALDIGVLTDTAKIDNIKRVA